VALAVTWGGDVLPSDPPPSPRLLALGAMPHSLFIVLSAFVKGRYNQSVSVESEGFCRRSITLRITGLLDFVHPPEFHTLENTAFRKQDLFPSSVIGRETTYSVEFLRKIFTFECCILLRIYLTGSL
jgi:hypothetical protein